MPTKGDKELFQAVRLIDSELRAIYRGCIIKVEFSYVISSDLTGTMLLSSCKSLSYNLEQLLWDALNCT